MKKLIFFLLLLVSFSCGTKTKTITENEIEVKAKEIAKEEDELKKIDSIVVSKIEEAKKEFSQIAKENSLEEGTKRTIIETRETVFDDMKLRPFAGESEKMTDDRTGRIYETRTIIDERFKLEKQKELEIKKIEQERITKDSIAREEIYFKKIKEALNESMQRQKNDSKEVVQKGFQLGFWFWFWFILILLIIILIWIGRKWIGIQFPFLRFIK